MGKVGAEKLRVRHQLVDPFMAPEFGCKLVQM
jgi:hypothetical protein